MQRGITEKTDSSWRLVNTNRQRKIYPAVVFNLHIRALYYLFFLLEIPRTFLKNLATPYVRLIVTHSGHTPNRKNSSPAFLYQGSFAGIIGQLAPSPLCSSMPHMLMDSFILCNFNYPKK
jgi:hypothetical protein